jgi:signal transduction histidine kinase
VTTTSLLFRIFLMMGVLYSVATFVVISINQSYFKAQSQYLEATQQVILLSRDTDEIFQIISLNGTTLDSQVDLLGMRPLPFECCESEYNAYVASITDGSDADWSGASMYRLSESSEQFLRAMYQTLLDQGEEVDQLRDMRDRVVPTTAIILLLLSLIVAFFLLDRSLTAPLKRLRNFIGASFRSAQPAPLDLTGAVSELRFLHESFESFIADYRRNLRSRDERATEMSEASDALERQFQRLIEISERPALILDASGAIRTWNKHMVALTGISKSQANRLSFSEELLGGDSAQLFTDAFKIARGGGIPDEFKCELRLRGGRFIKIQLQLSPQLESSLGVNRVLLVVTSSAAALTTDLDVMGPALSSTDSLLEELSASIHWLSKGEGTDAKQDALRQREALVAAVHWIGSRAYAREASLLNLGEIFMHFKSTFTPKLLDLDVDVDLNVVVCESPVMLRGNAGSVLIALEKLTDNALESIQKKAPSKGEIKAELSVAGDHARITITDNGTGISEEQESRIFEPFFTTKASGGHFGLGLTHSRDLIQDMGGRLFALRNSGTQGLELVIELPLVAS